MMDIAGMGILLGYAIGRIGCQLSGDGDWEQHIGHAIMVVLAGLMWSFNYLIMSIMTVGYVKCKSRII